MEFYEAWKYLNNHIIFEDENSTNRFEDCLDIQVVKVNPITKAIDDDETLNTKTRIWLEAGPYKNNCCTHDIDLDVGGKNFEKAIVKLAKKVKKIYGEGESAKLKVNKKYPEEE